MKLLPLFCLLGIHVFGSTLVFADGSNAVAAANNKSTKMLVAYAAPTKETARSRSISPGSGISLMKAVQVTSTIEGHFPGTTIYSVMATGSMRPVFDGNCLIMTEPAPFEKLEVGDIVVYWHKRTQCVVVHRILQRKGNSYWTKGDNNSRMDDELVTRENYRGRLYGIVYTKRNNSQPGYDNGSRLAKSGW